MVIKAIEQGYPNYFEKNIRHFIQLIQTIYEDQKCKTHYLWSIEQNKESIRKFRMRRMYRSKFTLIVDLVGTIVR